MDAQTIQDKILAVAQQFARQSSEPLNLQASLREQLSLDSLDMMDFSMQVWDEVGIEPPEEREEIEGDSIADYVRFVVSRQGEVK